MASVLFRVKHLFGSVSVLTKLLLICLAERHASSACGTSAESKHPEDVSFTILFQGVLSKKPFPLKSFWSALASRSSQEEYGRKQLAGWGLSRGEFLQGLWPP